MPSVWDERPDAHLQRPTPGKGQLRKQLDNDARVLSAVNAERQRKHHESVSRIQEFADLMAQHAIEPEPFFQIEVVRRNARAGLFLSKVVFADMTYSVAGRCWLVKRDSEDDLTYGAVTDDFSVIRVCRSPIPEDATRYGEGAVGTHVVNRAELMGVADANGRILTLHPLGNALVGYDDSAERLAEAARRLIAGDNPDY